MKHIKLFETVAAFETTRATLDLPNVSLIEATNGVNYLPYVSTPSHEYVEIGGVKWATMNVGATSITDYGLLFQWGDTQGYTASQVGSKEGQKPFKWSDTKYWTSDTGSGSSGFTKYNSADGITVLDASDDAVQANWGGAWRMPTTDEYVALGNAIDYIDADGNIISGNKKRTTLSGVTGIYVADKTDHSKRLFFPAAGYCYDGNAEFVGSYGLYWSSSRVYSDVVYAYNGLGFDVRNANWQVRNFRYYGSAVRGVYIG